ncbi:hypothetical protein NCS56_01547900 [Fusarium sp. Ph1]|nr:hypothetical protein NCS56_01547900 [Fusarium sp. Ph1]
MMGKSDRLSRQNELPVLSQQCRSLAGISGHRPRPESLVSSSFARGMGGAGNYDSYFQEPGTSFPTANMPAAAPTCVSEYGQDLHQQIQDFGGYNTSPMMMHNVAHGNVQNPAYDAQQLGSRRPETVMVTPDIASTHAGFETGSAGDPRQQQSMQGQQNGAMNNTSNMSVISATASALVSTTDDYDCPDGTLEGGLICYQQQLGTICRDTSNGSLESASEGLLKITSKFLSDVVELGLNLDDDNLREDRIKSDADRDDDFVPAASEITTPLI